MSDSDKQYDLTLEERLGYFYALVKADAITEKIAMDYLHEVTDRCRGIGCKRLLIYRDIPTMLADGTLFFVAAKFQNMIRGIKVAFVNKYTSNDDAFDFAVRVGTNRGANYGIFRSTEEAEHWLLGK